MKKFGSEHASRGGPVKLGMRTFHHSQTKTNRAFKVNNFGIRWCSKNKKGLRTFKYNSRCFPVKHEFSYSWTATGLYFMPWATYKAKLSLSRCQLAMSWKLQARNLYTRSLWQISDCDYSLVHASFIISFIYNHLVFTHKCNNKGASSALSSEG